MNMYIYMLTYLYSNEFFPCNFITCAMSFSNDGLMTSS